MRQRLCNKLPFRVPFPTKRTKQTRINTNTGAEKCNQLSSLHPAPPPPPCYFPPEKRKRKAKRPAPPINPSPPASNSPPPQSRGQRPQWPRYWRPSASPCVSGPSPCPRPASPSVPPTWGGGRGCQEMAGVSFELGNPRFKRGLRQSEAKMKKGRHCGVGRQEATVEAPWVPKI